MALTFSATAVPFATLSGERGIGDAPSMQRAADHARGPDQTIAYRLDMAALREAFDQTGSVSLGVPGGVLNVTGHRDRVRAGDHWSEVRADGALALHRDPSIPLDGTVSGVAGSTASLLLGEYGVYGRITIPGAQFLFDPAYDPSGGTFRQTASVTLGDTGPTFDFALSDCQQVPAPQGCPWPCGTPTQSFVQVDVDQRLQNIRPDWKDRATAAFKGHHGSYEMWKDICLELLMKDGSPRGIPDIGSQTSVVEALNGYTNWLNGDNSRTTESSAYNLFTDRDLYGCPNHEALCPGQEDNSVIGVAWGNRADAAPTTADKATQAGAVSIIEGKFYRCCYDPNKDWDMARVDGHELTHTYGEEDHHPDCKDSSHCNIMMPIFDEDSEQTYWIDWSRCEVFRYYFFAQDEYNGPREPCTDWYQP
jgi:hypothetical protein